MTCDGCERKTRFVLVEGDYTFANMNRYVDFMRREIFKWFLSLNLKVLSHTSNKKHKNDSN